MYKDMLSPCRSINAGVPQGSVLRPLLLMYVNDVAENMISLCRLFAVDNSPHYIQSYNVANIEYKLNYDLSVLDTRRW